jgi:hypothetical protein
VNQPCKGKLIAEYSEKQTNDTLRYLHCLFNVEKYNNENKNKGNAMKGKDHPDGREMEMLMHTVEGVLDQSKFNKVDLSALFAMLMN